MSQKQKVRPTNLIKIAIILWVLAALTAWVLVSFWRRPLGPSLGLPTQTPALSQAAALPSSSTSHQPLMPINLGQPPAPKPLCGGPNVINILAIGTDYRYDSYLYGLADVIKIVRVDFVTPKVMLLDFPRDLYVEIPGIAEHGGITHGKLNQPYLYGNPGLGYYDGPGQGPGLLARTLELNFNERPDHYIAVNMEVFVKIVDAVGGVDVNLPEWVLGLKPGTHHMNGTQALEFSRARPNGTFERTKHQDYVLSALRDKLLDPSVFTHIGSLITAFSGSVQTDLTPQQINQLTCIASQIPKDNFMFVSWPEGMFKGTRVDDPVLGNTFIWDVDKDLIRAYVTAFNYGQWPAPPPISAAINPTPTLPPHQP